MIAHADGARARSAPGAEERVRSDFTAGPGRLPQGSGAWKAAKDPVPGESAGRELPPRRWRGLLLAQDLTGGMTKVVRVDPEESSSPRTPGTAHVAVLSVSPGRSERGLAQEGLLFAQAASVGTRNDVGANPQQSQPSASSDSTSGSVVGALRGFSEWRLPPLRWGGNLTTDILADKAGGQPRRLRQTDIANIKGSSYIYQPWFALVSGGLGLVMSKELRDGGELQAAGQSQRTKSNAITGNGELTLFPLSRFPFNAFVDVSDSRVNDEAGSSDITNTRFGVRQSYRPQEGSESYTASFNHSTLKSQAFGRDSVNALAANINRSAGSQSFDVSGGHTSNTRSNTGERTAFSNAYARHSYRPEPELSVESLASMSSSEFRLLSAGVPSDNRSNFAQASSFATWRPEEDSPLLVTGGARMFHSTIANNAQGTQTLTLSGNMAATYALSRQTNLTASATVTQLATEVGSRRLTTQAASATRIGDPVGIFGADYTWNTGANLSNQTGAAEGMRQFMGGQFGHNLTRKMTLGQGSQAIFGVGQNAGTSYDTVAGRSQTLSHNANASWRLTSSTSTNAYVSLLGTDSRTRGANANDFQMINFQVSGQIQFNRNASVAANLTVQSARQNTPTAPSAGRPVNSSGTLGYFQQHAFGVPRLRYSALYGINEAQFKSRLQGDFDAPRERVNQSLEQRLDYNLGRIATRLSLRVAQVEGRRDALLFFRMNREFGGF